MDIIRSIRYDKRTFTYMDAVINTVWDEVVEDTLTAVDYLKNDSRIDKEKIVLVGLGLGAMTAPRIALQSEGDVKALIMIGGVLDSLINVVYEQSSEYLNTLTAEEKSNEQYIVRNFKTMSEGKSLEQTVLGRNAYYFWDAEQYQQAKLIRSLAIPVFVAQGKRDTEVEEEEGRRAYYETIGNAPYMEYESFRGLNHLLMDDLSVDLNGKSQYQVQTNVDKYAARVLGNWILALNSSEK